MQSSSRVITSDSVSSEVSRCSDFGRDEGDPEGVIDGDIEPELNGLIDGNIDGMADGNAAGELLGVGEDLTLQHVEAAPQLKPGTWIVLPGHTA